MNQPVQSIMRVYYMTSHAVATDYILPERRMKLSLFNELNDPFELQPYALSSAEARQVGRVLRSNIARKTGLLCFSDNWRSPVMWAHYADKHKGVCLGFDVPHEDPNCLIHRVDYNPNRLKIALDKSKKSMGLDRSIIRSLMFTKSAEWSYENEWRTLATLTTKDPETGHYYVDFGGQLQLREVILGERNDTPVGKMAKLINRNSAPVKVYKARAAFQEFAMVPNQAVRPIRVAVRPVS